MASGLVTVYSEASLGIGQAKFNFSTDTYVLILATSAYTVAPNTDATYANVSASEVATGGGYTAGGQVCAVTWSLTTATVTLTGATITWAAATISAKYAVLVRRAGASLISTDLLVGYFLLDSGGATVSSTNGNFVVSFPSNILTLTHTP